jgi:polar amino acid transport system substrate-binding protein
MSVEMDATLKQMNWRTRRRLLCGGLGVAAAVAASPLLPTYGQDDIAAGVTIERLRSEGAKFGVSAGLPSCGVEGGKAVGIFPEVAEVVLKRLGVEKFIPVLTSFDGIIPGLQAGRVDLALGGLYITAKRCDAILFSHPVIRYGDALVVLKGNPKGFKNMDDVAKSDAMVGTIAGSTGSAYLKKLGIPSSRQVIFPDLPSILDGMKAGRVDVAGSDAIGCAYLLKYGNFSDSLELIPLVEQAKFSGGVGFRRDALDLQTAFNDELRNVQANRELTPVFAKWNVPADALKGVLSLSWQSECEKLT